MLFAMLDDNCIYWYVLAYTYTSPQQSFHLWQRHAWRVPPSQLDSLQQAHQLLQKGHTLLQCLEVGLA